MIKYDFPQWQNCCIYVLFCGPCKAVSWNFNDDIRAQFLKYDFKKILNTVLPMGKLCRWMAAKQSKIEEKQENMVETNQKWQKTDKNDRKPWKMWSFANYLLPSSHFCLSKLPLLSCQAAISVLPSSHFCPAKLTNFSRGGQGPLGPPPNTPMVMPWKFNSHNSI